MLPLKIQIMHVTWDWPISNTGIVITHDTYVRNIWRGDTVAKFKNENL